MDKNQNYFNESVAHARKEIFDGRFTLNETLSAKYNLKIYDYDNNENMLYVLDWGECYTESEIAETLNTGRNYVSLPLS